MHENLYSCPYLIDLIHLIYDKRIPGDLLRGAAEVSGGIINEFEWQYNLFKRYLFPPLFQFIVSIYNYEL